MNLLVHVPARELKEMAGQRGLGNPELSKGAENTVEKLVLPFSQCIQLLIQYTKSS